MKVIRRSPVTRVTAWLLTLALIAPILFYGRAARAQDQQILRLIIADVVNRTPGASRNLGVNTTAALYSEFANSGVGKFNIASTSEVRNEAISLGIKVPSNPATPAFFTKADLLRIAKSLNADGIVTGEVGATKVLKGKPAQIGMIVKIEDVAANIPINGGSSVMSAAVRPGEPLDIEEQYNRAIADAAQDTVRQIVQRQVPTGTVLNINGDNIILNRGIRDGYKVGDRVIILREGANGFKTKEGEVRIARAYATDSEADILENKGGIQPEDLTRVFYEPPIKFAFVSAGPSDVGTITVSPTAKGPSFSMAAIGGTLGVIAVGVLVAQASRGGQQSVTDLTAEASSAGNSPTVLLRWRDNIFGQGNVQQYKIWRDEDFPYAVTPPTGNQGGTTVTGSIPVDVVSGLDHQYIDLPSPHLPYATGKPVLLGSSNGGLGSQAGSGSNQGNGTNNSVGVLIPAPGTDTGFTAGRSYHYLVSAILIRSIPSSGSTGGTGGGGVGGGSGGGGVGGGGNGGNGNNGGGTELIETDPARAQLATPINPVILITPSVAAGNVNAKAFSPTWNSRSGADIFQLEISTDRTFKKPSLIYTQQVISTAPNADGVPQSIPSPIDLTTLPQLLADPNFAAFVAQANGTTPNPPPIYWRVGARHDADIPGPVHWITTRADEPDRTFRFVYPQPTYFTAAPLPPPPPGRRAENSKAAAALNRQNAGRAAAAPKPGDTSRTRAQSQSRVLSPQEILSGGSRRRN